MPDRTEKLIAALLAIPAEDRRTEFKRLGEPGDRLVGKIVETIVAMANTDGGIIVLGIDDPQQTKLKGFDRIFGIEEGPERYDEIGRNIRRISPPMTGLWPPQHLSCANGKTAALLRVPKAITTFHTLDDRVIVRGEKGNDLIKPHQLIRFQYAKGFQHADSELVPIDFALLQTDYYEQWRRSREPLSGAIETVLFSTGLARRDTDGAVRPTRAAVLLFALYPNDLLETKCTIRVLQYEGIVETVGTTLNLIGKPETIKGPVIRQIVAGQEYLLTILRAGMRIPGSGFQTQYRIPERAVKEAITNAVIHRDYFIKRDIEVKIFEDRVEIESPGLLPSNITPANIGLVRAESYRNDLLVKHLREFPNPPNLDLNEGVKAMRSDMAKHHLYPPAFVTYPQLPDSVRVVLLSEIKATEWDKVHHFLTHKEKVVANQTVRRILRQEDTNKVSRMMKKWAEQGLLEVINSGSKKNRKYRLPIDPAQEGLLSNANDNKNKV